MKDYDNSAMERAIDERIHSETRRRVLKLRLIDGLTYEKIAEAVDISPRQVGYIIAQDAHRLMDFL